MVTPARLRATACLLSFLSCAPVVLTAQGRPRVLVDALVGFNGAAREGRFAPLLVSVSTPGARVTADVTVDVTWGSSLRGTQGTRRYVHHDTFAAGGLRRLPFVFPLTQDARSLAVTVSSDGTTLARTEVDLHAAATTERLVAGISSTLSLDALADLSAGALRVVYPRIDDLPDSWGGYDGVDMVVVHDTFFRQLRDAQVSALERWVVAGGTVVFTGGADALQHESAGWGTLLPVRVTGLGERSSLPELSALGGGAPAPRGHIPVAESTVRDGTVLARQGDLPLVVRRVLGQGAVWFLAVDPTLEPLASWPGTLALWRSMEGGESRPLLDFGARQVAEDSWMGVMLSTPPFTFPPQLLVLLFCVGYLALLLLAIAIRGKPRARVLLRAAALCTLPLAAAGTAWVLFNRVTFQPSPLLLDASVARVRSGDALASVTEKVGLYASRPAQVSLSFAPTDLLVDEIAPFAAVAQVVEQSPALVSLETGKGAALPSLGMGKYGSRLVAASGVVPMPVTVSIDDASRITVVNDSAAWLRHAWVWRGGKAWPLGDIAPGSTVSRSAGSDDGVDIHTAAGLAQVNGTDQRVNFWNLVSPGVDSSPGVLVAWLDEAALRFTAAGARRAPERPELSLLVVVAS